MLKENLVMLRNIHGYTQEEIAERIGISRQAYAKWENGATVPDIEKCSLLAKIYGTTIDSLVRTESLEGIGELPPAPIGKNIWGFATVGEEGRIDLPEGVMERFSLTEGQRLVVMSDEHGIALIPEHYFEEMMKMNMAQIKKWSHF